MRVFVRLLLLFRRMRLLVMENWFDIIGHTITRQFTEMICRRSQTISLRITICQENKGSQGYHRKSAIWDKTASVGIHTTTIFQGTKRNK